MPATNGQPCPTFGQRGMTVSGYQVADTSCDVVLAMATCYFRGTVHCFLSKVAFIIEVFDH